MECGGGFALIVACLLGAEGGGEVKGKWEWGDEYQGWFCRGGVVREEVNSGLV